MASNKVVSGLEGIVDYWKQRLGLASWEIRISEVTRYEQETCAAVFVQPQIERARITVWQSCDRDESCDDVELDIIHELVHVRLWSIEPEDVSNSAQYYCKEAAVEWLARALYSVRHDGKMGGRSCVKSQATKCEARRKKDQLGGIFAK